MAAVNLTHLRRYFGSVKAVDDVSLSIDDGEFIALLGPSGCGKTTTLRIVAGLEATDGGHIEIGSQDVTTLPARERDVAMVFQDYALYPHMTVEENVGYPLKVRGLAAAEWRQRVRQVAERLQIGELLDRRPAQLSGGQQQRVSLARAVVHRARATLYDEPLSNLDTKLRLEARAFLKHLQHEVGITSIYVTHDQAEAMALADRIVVMNAGKIMQVGSPVEIYREPANTYVASFIGSPPVNLIPCHVDASERRFVFEDNQSLAFPNALPHNISRAVTLGIRPEHLGVHAEPADGRLAVQTYVVQLLGGESVVVAYLGSRLIAARLFVEQPPILPATFWISFDASRLFFYDSQGERLA